MLSVLIEKYLGGSSERIEQLAQRVGISTSTVKQMRYGYVPSIPTLKLLAVELGVPESLLLKYHATIRAGRSKPKARSAR